MPDLTLYRATVTAYDPATHSAAVTLLEGPAAALAGVRCTLQCAAAELTVGERCLVGANAGIGISLVDDCVVEAPCRLHGIQDHRTAGIRESDVAVVCSDGGCPAPPVPVEHGAVVGVGGEGGGLVPHVFAEAGRARDIRRAEHLHVLPRHKQWQVRRGRWAHVDASARHERGHLNRFLFMALAAGGTAGVVRMLELLETEIRTNLALMGLSSIDQLNPNCVLPAEPVVRPHVLSGFPLLDEGY